MSVNQLSFFYFLEFETLGISIREKIVMICNRVLLFLFLSCFISVADLEEVFLFF